MKKLFIVTSIILLVSTIHHVAYSADDRVPDFQINGLEGLIKQFGETSKDAMTAALHESEPGLRRILKNTLVESAPHILLSTAGLIITSAGMMLVYQGLKADSSIENDDTSTKKVDTTKLLGYGGALVIIGVATIMHTSIKNLFSAQK
jgi:hypothetical protein